MSKAPAIIATILFASSISTASARALIPTSRDLDLCARTVYGEARGQTTREQFAIVHVIYNRMRVGRRLHSVESVVLAPRQFSTWNADDPNLPVIIAPGLERTWRFKRMLRICTTTIGGRMLGVMRDPTHGANHYFHGPRPYWAENVRVLKIGQTKIVKL